MSSADTYRRKTDTSTAKLNTLPASSIDSTFPAPPENGDGDGEDEDVVFAVVLDELVELSETPPAG